MKCPNCGHEIADNCLFCTSCGTKINQNPAASAQAENSAAQNLSAYIHQSTAAPPPRPDYIQSRPSGNRNTCKVCGGTIDPKTNVCTTCGKQYFKMSAVFISLIAVSVAAVVLVVFTVVKISSLNRTVSEQQSSIETLSSQLDLYQDKVDFMDEYVVIVVEGDTAYYHKFGCPGIEGKNFWVYNITAAKTQGYIPDPECNK